MARFLRKLVDNFVGVIMFSSKNMVIDNIVSWILVQSIYQVKHSITYH